MGLLQEVNLHIKMNKVRKKGSKQTESLVITTREIRSESCRSVAWYHWAILIWILNNAVDVVGFVSQSVWALVVDIGGLLYSYIVTKK